MADKKYIVDMFEEIVASVRADYDTINGLQPYYDYGHIMDIQHKLAAKDEDNNLKFQKYPLVALILDIKEDHEQELNYDYEFPCKILLLHTTDKNYTSQERYANVLKTVLYPIYELLLSYIRTYYHFDFKPTMRVPHEKYDRVFWGNESANGNTATILNDYLDGIELNFEPIKVNEYSSTCQ